MYDPNQVAKGTLAGFLATLPMTGMMLIMHRRLPWWQQGPLPPHKIVSQLLESLDLNEIEASYHNTTTLVGHFSYGAVTGAFYPLIHKLPMPLYLKSSLYGVSVWAGSYMGWLPASGLLEPATKRPWQRNALMIAAHIIWGLTAGVIYSILHKANKQ